MRAVEIQQVNAQTPGVERAHQNRPQQSEVEQRQFQNIARDSQDAKMLEAQETAEDREAQLQLEQEQERKSKDSRSRKREEGETDEDTQQKTITRGRNLSTGRTVDIII